MARLRLFGPAREAAGTGSDLVPGSTVDEVLRGASDRYGQGFAELLPGWRIWVNGELADGGLALAPDDEVGVLPPFSGG
jgi:molybdopterin converting factor small subunit